MVYASSATVTACLAGLFVANFLEPLVALFPALFLAGTALRFADALRELACVEPAFFPALELFFAALPVFAADFDSNFLPVRFVAAASLSAERPAPRPLCSIQRFFCAAAIRALPSADMVRRFGTNSSGLKPVARVPDPFGRPGRRTSSATLGWSISRSTTRCNFAISARRLWIISCWVIMKTAY